MLWRFRLLCKKHFDLKIGAALAHLGARDTGARAEGAAPCQINKNLSVFNSNADILKFGISKFALNAEVFNAYFGLPKYKELAAAQVGKKGIAYIC